MVSKPTQYLNWTDGASSKALRPSLAKRLMGWRPGERPAMHFMNYALYLLDQWAQWFDTTHYFTQNIRMLDGGLWSFNAGTGALNWSSPFYLAVPGVSDTVNEVYAGGVTLASGWVAYVTLCLPFTFTGDITNGSATIQNVSDMTQITIGQILSNANLPANVVVTSLGTDSFTLSANATGTAAGATITAISPPATVKTAEEQFWAPGPQDILIARRHGSYLYLGEGQTQKVLADGDLTHQLLDGAGPTTAVWTEAQLSAAITALNSTGGAIQIAESFTCSGTHTFPDNIQVFGKGPTTKITCTIDATWTFGNKSGISNLAFDFSSVTSGTFCVKSTGTYFKAINCDFTGANTSTSGTLLQVNGNYSIVEDNRFYGVLGAPSLIGLGVGSSAADCYANNNTFMG